MPTYTTLPLLLLVLLLWRWTRGNLLAILAFTSIFDAASVLNFGALGVSPWLLALLLCLPVKIARGQLHPRLAPGSNRTTLFLLVSFLACAAFSGFVYPILFHGTPIIRAGDLVALAWGMPNVAQLCYLAAAAVVFLLTFASTPEERAEAITWYVRGCIVATFIALYQLANAVLHVPYPNQVLYSNTAHVVYRAYRINGMWRLNGSFTEASDMAGSLIGGLGILGWDLIHNPLKASRTLCFALMLAAILMTLSTTGYACLALMFALGAGLYLRYVVRSGGVDPAKLVVLVLLAMTLGTVFVVSPGARTSAGKLFSSVVLDKRGTDSYKVRTESQGDALRTLAATDYLGAGLGSTRASGLAYTLLASTGVAGLLLFTVGYLSLFLPFFRPPRRRPAPGSEDRLLERSMVALTLLLCGMVLAGSEPIMPVLWLLFGIALVSPRGHAGAGRARRSLAGGYVYVQHTAELEAVPR